LIRLIRRFDIFMIHFRSKGFHVSWVLAIIAAGAALFYVERRFQTTVENIPINPNHTITKPILPKNTNQPDSAPAIASSLLIPVPFTPQAPTANWDTLHNEACEEASAIMAHAYFEGMKDSTLDPSFVEEEIAKLTEWETNAFGYYLDINTKETARLLEEFYNLKTKILTDYSADDIKQELLQNHIVLWPANGKLLGNPNFRSPGPPYHMLVIKGYNSLGFITNDPGTRKGLNYPYSFSTLYKANGDFDHEAHEVDLSKKMVISVWK